MSRTVYADVCEQFTRCVAALPSPRPSLLLLYTRRRDRAPTHRVAVSTPPVHHPALKKQDHMIMFCSSKLELIFMTLSEN